MASHIRSQDRPKIHSRCSNRSHSAAHGFQSRDSRLLLRLSPAIQDPHDLMSLVTSAQLLLPLHTPLPMDSNAWVMQAQHPPYAFGCSWRCTLASCQLVPPSRDTSTRETGEPWPACFGRMKGPCHVPSATRGMVGRAAIKAVQGPGNARGAARTPLFTCVRVALEGAGLGAGRAEGEHLGGWTKDENKAMGIIRPELQASVRH